MNHWETHLYTFAVALTQGDKIKPENLEGMRRKAIRHGHSAAECTYVERNAQLYIATGIIDLTYPVTIYCASCGSENVKADAYAEWNPELQMWEIVSLFDNTDCEDCGGECSTVEREIAQ